jgi:AcrR family transcriptional regulator
MGRKTDTRETILLAAEAVVAKAGAAHLTLDAVAAAARLSKGGLLYHFPSKEALLQAMLVRLLEMVDRDRARFESGLGAAPAADLEAHVLAGFETRAESKGVSAALLAAGANDPRLLEPVRAWHKKHFQQIVKRKAKPLLAAAVMLAVDGYWLNELLQTSPMNSAERKQVREVLLELARSAA